VDTYDRRQAIKTQEAAATTGIHQIRSALQIVVDLDLAEQEIEERWQMACAISQHSKLFLEGKISGGDFLDLAEMTGVIIDQYADEVEQNLEEIGFLLC
jgi:sorbitol-specific phosphotransferase system component IIA